MAVIMQDLTVTKVKLATEIVDFTECTILGRTLE